MMPNRPKDKYNTILVKFYDDIGDKEARSLLSHMGVGGARVSTLIKRWAVEVPYWRETEYLHKFYDSEIVMAIHDSFDKSEGISEEQPNDQQGE